MRNRITVLILVCSAFLFVSCQSGEGQWTELFNGKDLTGWTANQHPESFKVENGLLVANGQSVICFIPAISRKVSSGILS